MRTQAQKAPVIDLNELYREIIGYIDSLMSVIGGGVALLNRQMEIVYYSSVYEEWYGPLEENAGRSCYEIFCKRGTQCPGCHLENVVDEVELAGASFEQRIEIRGEYRLVRMIFFPVIDPNGAVNHIIEVIEDITEKHEAAEELTRRTVYLMALNRVAEAIFRSESIHQALPTIVEVLAETLETQAVCLYLHNPQNDHYVLQASTGLPLEIEEFYRVQKPDAPLVEKSRRAERCVRLVPQSTHRNQPVIDPWPLQDTEAVMLPIVSNESLLGFFLFFFRGNRMIEEEEFCTSLQGHFSAAIERSLISERFHGLESRYRQLFEASPDVLLLIDEDMCIIDVNRKITRTGYRMEEVLGHHVQDFLVPEDREEGETAIRRAMHGETVVMELDILKKNGSTAPREFSIAAFHLDDQPSAVVVSRDITRRKKAEKRDRMLANLTRTVTDAIVGIDREFRIIAWNPGARQLFGYEPEEVLGKHCGIMHAPGEASAEELADRAVRHGGVQLEVFYSRKDGEIFDGVLSMSPLRDEKGNLEGFVKYIKDITEINRQRKEKEHEIRRMAKFTQAVTDAIITVDTDLRISTWNPGAERIFNYTSEEILGRPIDVLSAPETKPTAADVARVVEEQGEFVSETTMQKKDGRPINTIVSVSRLEDEEGKTAGFLGFVKDVTQIKQMQAQLVQAQKMESIGTLAGGLAHDVKNIISSILGQTSFLREGLGEGSDLIEYVNEIETASRRATDLARQLLAFAKGGRRPEEPKEAGPVDLNRVASDTIRLIARTLSSRISVRQKLQSDLHAIKGDAGQLEQIIMNLVLNSSEAMPEGGTITVETKNITLRQEDLKSEYENARPGRYVLLIVSDTGAGMDEETRRRALEPFYTRKEEGTGLGLSVVYGIVRGHNGFITIYSELGKGTTTKIYLPAASEKVEKKTAGKEKIARGSGETILVVEDEEMVRQALTRMLRKLNYNVISAKTGKEAIEIYAERKEEVSLIILDLILPDLEGIVVFDNLKAENADARVLLSSGYSESQAVLEAENRGAVGFLEKPYTMIELAQIVHEALQQQPAHAGTMPVP